MPLVTKQISTIHFTRIVNVNEKVSQALMKF